MEVLALCRKCLGLDGVLALCRKCLGLDGVLALFRKCIGCDESACFIQEVYRV